MDTRKNRLGDFIRTKRIELGLSLRDFAKMCSVSHSHIQSIEKGLDPKTQKPVRPTIDIIAKISQGAELDINTLIDLALQDSASDYSYSTIYPPPVHSDDRSHLKNTETKTIPLYFTENNCLPAEYQIGPNIKGDFSIIVSDDSMKNIGIYNSDIAIFLNKDPVSGQIVAVNTSKEILIRFYTEEDNKMILRSANPMFPEITLSDKRHVVGTLSAIIRKTIPTYQEYKSLKIKETE